MQEPEDEGEDNTVHEPPKKVCKVSARLGLGSTSIKLLRVKEDARVLTVGDLQKLYAVYVANKAKQAAAAGPAGAESPAAGAPVATPTPPPPPVAPARESTPIMRTGPSVSLANSNSSSGSASASTSRTVNSPSVDALRTLSNNAAAAERVAASGARTFKRNIPVLTTGAKAML
jgi:hypothetical protein